MTDSMFLKYAESILSGPETPLSRSLVEAFRNSAGLAAWTPMFEGGIRKGSRLRDHLFALGVEAGKTGLSSSDLAATTGISCEHVCSQLLEDIDRTRKAADALVRHALQIPEEDRDAIFLRVTCDYTGVWPSQNLRCRVFPDFGRYRVPPGFDVQSGFDRPNTYFMYVEGMRGIQRPKGELDRRVANDMAALVVLAFEECLAILGECFELKVEERPTLLLERDPGLRGRRRNAGLCLETPEETIARESGMMEEDASEDARILLDRFATSFPKGTPEEFVAIFEAEPKRSRRDTIAILASRGYVSGPYDRMSAYAFPGRPPGPLTFDNRSLSGVVIEVAKALDLMRPEWRSRAHVAGQVGGR